MVVEMRTPANPALPGVLDESVVDGAEPASMPRNGDSPPPECLSSGVRTRDDDRVPTTRHAGFSGRACNTSSLGQVLTMVALACMAFVWAFWHTFAGLWHVWMTNADYSVGLLVPPAVAGMIFARRARLRSSGLKPEPIGLLVFIFGLGIDLLGIYYLYSSLEHLGMIISLYGLVLALIGRRSWRGIWFPMLFLCLMVPLPGRAHDVVMLPLQRLATQCAAVMLEIVGVPVERFGHVLETGGRRIAVAEACNGLRMVLAFLFIGGLVAYLAPRPRWQKVVILLSSIPIAFTCNVLRVVATTYLYTAGLDQEMRDTVHDGFGLLMMPLALLLILLELRILSRLDDAGRADRRAGVTPAKAVRLRKAAG